MNGSSEKAVLFFTLGYHPVVGGTERQVQLLAEQWAKTGREVWVVTHREKGTPAEEVLGGVRIFRRIWFSLPGLTSLIIGTRMFFFLLARRKKIGCLIIQMFNTPALLCAMAANFFSIPVIVKPSAGGPDGNLDKIRRSFFGSWKAGLLARRLTALVSINEQIFAEVREVLPDSKIKSIPNGIDAQQFSPVPADERRKLRERRIGISNTGFAVLFVGRLDKVKNLETFLQAFEEISREKKNLVFIIAGDGPDKATLRKSVADKKLEERVRFLGAIPNTRDYFRMADVFVLPSVREGTSNALLEAMACGLPALVSHIPGNKILANESTAVLLDPLDAGAWARALRSLLDDPAARQRLGAAARQRIETNFSIDKTVAAYDLLTRRMALPFFKKPFPILTYHRTQAKPEYGIDISTAQFDRQMKWLSENGYSTLSLLELFEHWENGRPVPVKKVLITFDDGHKDTYEEARPVLKKFGFGATLFLNSGLLGRQYWVSGRKPEPVVWHPEKPTTYDPTSKQWRVYEFMSWEQAKELARDGFEIASHGVNHPFLTQLPDDELQRELVDSKRTLEEKLGQPVHFFCYPSGDNDGRVRQAVAAAGYKGAVMSVSHYEMDFIWDDPYRFQRIGLWNDVKFWKFKALVTGRYQCWHRAIPPWVWSVLRSFYRLARG